MSLIYSSIYNTEVLLRRTASGYHSTLHSQSLTAVKHGRESVKELEKVLSFVEHLRIILGTQYQSARRDVDALAFRTGFSSLPDEIVAEILVFATRPSKTKSSAHIDIVAEMRALAEARSLSHVCRRFRSLVLNSSRIWGVISEHMTNLSEVKFVINHSGTTPMTVVLDHCGLLQRSNLKFQKFFETCLLSSNRWSSFTLGNHSYQDTNRGHSAFRWLDVRSNISTISRITTNLTLPVIRRLCVDYSAFLVPEHLDAKFHPYLRWSMPNLTELRLSGCHPPPAQTSFSSTLRSVSIHFETASGPAYTMSRLKSFLASCDVLETVNIYLVGWTSVVNMSGPPLAVSRVQKALLSFYECTPAVVDTFCHSIHYPNAAALHLTLSDLRFETMNTNGDQESASSKYESLIRKFLIHHPSVKSLEISFRPSTRVCTPIVVPITVLPALEVLSLSFASWGELDFWKETSSASFPAIAFRLPPIRRLELTDVDLEKEWRSVSNWTKRFFAQMKEQGDLDAFEMLAIFGGDRRSMESTRSSVATEVCAYLPAEKISFFEPR